MVLLLESLFHESFVLVDSPLDSLNIFKMLEAALGSCCLKEIPPEGERKVTLVDVLLHLLDMEPELYRIPGDRAKLVFNLIRLGPEFVRDGSHI